MATESSEPAEPLEMVAGSNGETELTLEGGDCRVTVRGPEGSGEDRTRWVDALRGAHSTWLAMQKVVHAARMEELRVEHSVAGAGAGTGFVSERSGPLPPMGSEETLPHA